MTLIELNQMPPKGYPYFEPSINWRVPDPFQTIDVVARQLQMARVQNPASELNPSYEACLEAIKLYTCVRLKGHPKFCGPQVSSENQPWPSSVGRMQGCAGCARR